MVDLNRVIGLAIKSGKVLIGSKQTIIAAKSGKVVAVVVALNCPKKIVENIKYHSTLSKIPMYVFPSSSVDLGGICSKPFGVSALAIRETNDPDILKMKQALSEE